MSVKKRKANKIKDNNQKNKSDYVINRILGVSLLFLVFLLIFWLILTFSEQNKISEKKLADELGYLGSLGIFTTNIRGFSISQNNVTGLICDDSILRSLWELFFNESSSDITIIKDNLGSPNCNKFLMYKTNGLNMTYLIIDKSAISDNIFSEEIYCAYGNLSENFTKELYSTNSSNIDNFVSSYCNDNLLEQSKTNNRDISSYDLAEEEYSKIYNLPSTEWQYFQVPPFNDFSYFIFENSSITNNITFYKRAILKRYSQIDMLNYRRSFMVEPTPGEENITFVNNIPNINLNEGFRYFSNVLDLDDYFANLNSRTDLSFNYRLSGSEILFFAIPSTNFSINHKIDFDSRSSPGGTYLMNVTLSYPGQPSVTSNSFHVNIIGCSDSDLGVEVYFQGNASNQSHFYKDECRTTQKLREYYCNLNKIVYQDINCEPNYYCKEGACVNESVNFPPEFLNDSCREFGIEKNNEFEFDMSDCFRDRNHDKMVFRFENGSNENITIDNYVDSRLLLTPDEDWVGSGHFTIFANDSFNETSGRIELEVYEPGNYSDDEDSSTNPNLDENYTEEDQNQTDENNLEEDNNIEIIDFYPLRSEVYININQKQNFSIGNEEYDSIKWYLNDVLVKEDDKNYQLEELNYGNYSLRVEINKGDKTGSKIWNLVIRTEEPQTDEAKIKEVLFYFILLITSLVIVLVFWALILEIKKEKSTKINSILKVKPNTKEKNSFNLPEN